MVKNNAKYLLLVSLIFLNLGCTQQFVDRHAISLGNNPDWLNEDSREYPRHLFIRGYGVSADLELAKQRAIDDLARAFDAETKSFFEQGNDAQIKLNKRRLRRYILEYNQIAEVWQDPVAGVFNVLNIIDRVAAGAQYEEEIYRIDSQLQRYMEKVSQETDALQKIAFIRQAIIKHTERQDLQRVLTVIKPTTALANSPWNEQQIKHRLAELLTQVKIKPVAANNDINVLQGLMAGVQDAGFIVDHGIEVDYILKASFQQDHLKWEAGVYKLQGRLRLELLDGEASGLLRGSATWPIQVSATNREMLNQRLGEAVKKANQEKLKTTFVNFETK